jgi:hypothetical protein
MGRELARHRPVPVAALETGAGLDGFFQLAPLDAGDERSHEIADPVPERSGETAGQDRLIGQPDSRLGLRRNRHGLEPHRRLDPAELVRELGRLRRLNLEPGRLQAGQALVSCRDR